MPKPRPTLFKWRHFEPEIIVCAVRWYLRFSLSYRDVEELLIERGLPADHTTIWKSVKKSTPSGNSGIDSSAFVFVSQSDQSSTSLENAVVDSSLPRLRHVDRAQMCWHVVDVECLIEEDHPVRAIWELTGRLNLASFLAPIGSGQG